MITARSDFAQMFLARCRVFTGELAADFIRAADQAARIALIREADKTFELFCNLATDEV